MRLQTLNLSHEEFYATYEKLWEAARTHIKNFDSVTGRDLIALDSDFLPTNNLNNARWLFTDSMQACCIVKIGNDGTMMQLRRD